jgi:hypothetical protein
MSRPGGDILNRIHNERRSRAERRSHARFDYTVEAHGTPETGDVVARMVASDLSLGGLYCSSSVDFPEMTRLAIRLLLPERRTGAPEPLEVDAVVVRHREMSSPTGNSRYELALFFSGMSDHQRERLARFLAVA